MEIPDINRLVIHQMRSQSKLYNDVCNANRIRNAIVDLADKLHDLAIVYEHEMPMLETHCQYLEHAAKTTNAAWDRLDASNCTHAFSRDRAQAVIDLYGAGKINRDDVLDYTNHRRELFDPFGRDIKTIMTAIQAEQVAA